MIKCTKEVRFFVTEMQVKDLFLVFTNNSQFVPPGHIGYDDNSVSERSLTVFEDCAQPEQQTTPKENICLVSAPVSTVAGFSIKSLKGTYVYGAREWHGADFSVIAKWEVLRYKEESWLFEKEPAYLQQFGVKVEYPKHERSIITAALGYSPFMR